MVVCPVCFCVALRWTGDQFRVNPASRLEITGGRHLLPLYRRWMDGVYLLSHSFHPSIYPFTHPSVYPFSLPLICPSSLSVFLSICPCELMMSQCVLRDNNLPT
ncbi:hypothetical protein XENORESO_011341 [Xenotaenia resolanae]|uniref:Secreted protein n=1 Tax=Xenotaenia resolanae TaxID=208358 RepID=A0ABV0W8F0_9TELE